MVCVWLFLLTSNTYSIAKQKSKLLRIITDENQITNYLDVASLDSSKPQKFYTSARIFPHAAVNNREMPLRRPDRGERCPCPYDFAINESHCGGRASGKTTCFAPRGSSSLLISNSVNCETKVRSILNIDIYDKNNKQITTYSVDTLTGGAYPVAVKVSDQAEMSVIKAVCK
jgi:hypothetical protein